MRGVQSGGRRSFSTASRFLIAAPDFTVSAVLAMQAPALVDLLVPGARRIKRA
jgi:hypothetical protein